MASFLLMASAYAMGPGDGPAGEKDGKKMEAHMKKIEKQLGLSPDQEKKIEDNRQAHKDEFKKLFEDMKDKRKALNEEFDKPDFSEDRARAIQGEIKDLQGKMADGRLERLLEMKKILTPDQFKKFRELTREEWGKDGKRGHDGHHGEHHGSGDDGPPSK